MPRRAKPTSRYLFFVRNGPRGPVHFEVAEHPRLRIYDLQKRASEQLVLLAVSPADKFDESALTGRFARALLPGDGNAWYKPTTELLSFIETLEHVQLPSAPRQTRHFKTVLLSLSPESVERLGTLAESWGLTKSGVVDHLLWSKVDPPE